MKDDLTAVSEPKYFGRGLIAGATPDGNYVVANMISGRSPSSQARRFKIGEKTKIISTEPTDIETLQKGNPALLIYPALVPIVLSEKSPGGIIGSNGVQTELIITEARGYGAATGVIRPSILLNQALETSPQLRYDPNKDEWIDIRTFEPDKPHFTPRISVSLFNGEYGFSFIWRNEKGIRIPWEYTIDIAPGTGHFISTYEGGNEDPLQPFKGNPREVRLSHESAEDIANSLFEAMAFNQIKEGDDLRVGVGVIVMDPNKRGQESLDVKVINRCEVQ